MTFEEYWAEIEKLKLLPNTAIRQLPSALSRKTKSELMKKHPEDAVEILKKAINAIDCGSIESVDNLVTRLL